VWVTNGSLKLSRRGRHPPRLAAVTSRVERGYSRFSSSRYRQTRRIQPFSATLPADAGLLFDLRQSLRKWLRTGQLPPTTQDALVLAVHEAVANGIEHANGSSVSVHGGLDDRGLIVDVTTRGPWIANERDDVWLAERGRGLALMKGLTELEIVVSNESVTIRLRPSRS
jgi:anti-sigma regulatory factor (Ser/Thr protein kinase)